MTAAKQAKAAGLKSLTQVSNLTGQSLQTLGNWSKHKPELFAIVLLGCKAKIDDEYWGVEEVEYNKGIW